MTRRAPPLSGLLAEIARAGGVDAALAIARKLGGTRVYFPVKPEPDHMLSQLIGHEAALAVCDELTGGRCGLAYDIPLGQFGHQETLRAKVDRLIAEGATERDIALATRYTERGVRKRKQALREREPDLFDC